MFQLLQLGSNAAVPAAGTAPTALDGQAGPGCTHLTRRGNAHWAAPGTAPGTVPGTHLTVGVTHSLLSSRAGTAPGTHLTRRGNIHWAAPRGWWAPHRRAGNVCQWPPWSGCWLLWDPGPLPMRNSLGPDVSGPAFYKPKDKKAEEATFTRSCHLKVWAVNVLSHSSVMF